MPPKQGSGRTQQIQLSEDTSWDRLKARGASKVAPLLVPWLLWPMVFGVAAAFHAIFGSAAAVPWAAVALTIGSGCCTALTWAISHYQRRTVGRYHTTLTMGLLGGWLTIATITGPTQPVVLGLVVLVGFFLCLSWNLRHVIRQKAEDQGVTDPLDKLFGDAFDDHAKGARVKTKAIGPYKAEAEADLQGTGKTVDDLTRRKLAIEGDAGVPPGAMSFTQNPDRAGTVDVTITDSRAMKKPLPWPGPYLPGQSIGEPLRLGMWQDMDPVLYRMVNHHLQIAGKSGSGKTMGGLYSFMAEIIPRTEREIWLADITKGKQTWGPIRPALHRLADTPEKAKQMVRDLHAEIKKRTDYLGEKDLDHWVPGCGIDHLVAWFEEIPDITDKALSDKEIELFVSCARTARSAGIFLVLSMQRFDWTVLPTQIRGQMARMTMGVEDSHEAGFALSDRQINADCQPELWADRQPGMAFIDAPSIADARISMPWRTWFHDRDQLAALAAQYPAQPPRTPDSVDGPTDLVAAAEVADGEDAMDDAVELLNEAAALVTQTQHASTAMLQRKLRLGSEESRAVMRALQRQGVVKAVEGDDGQPVWKVLRGPDDGDEQDDDDLGDVASEYLETEDPDPTTVADIDDEIPLPPADEFRFQRPEKLPTDEARGLLRGRIEEWAAEGRTGFATRDLADLIEETGRSRAWFQKECKALADEGVIERDDEKQRYLLTAPVGV